MKFYFDPKLGDKHERRKAVGDIYYYLIDYASNSEKTGKPFEVNFSEKKENKSWEQIKGIHLLCTKLIPHLSIKHNTQYSLEDIKNFVKREFNYMRNPTKFEAALMLKSIDLQLNEEERKEAFNFCKKIKQPKSFADASKEEMINLINEIEAWAATEAWKDVYLESREKEALINFYEQQKGKQ